MEVNRVKKLVTNVRMPYMAFDIDDDFDLRLFISVCQGIFGHEAVLQLSNNLLHTDDKH